MGNILIVDDDEQLRKSFKKIVEEEGYAVKSASTGEQCIKEVQDNQIDLVIMDIKMPGMTGLQALKEIHKSQPKLPVIIMTAYGTTETAIEATKHGAFDYILKPFDVPEMLELIEKALEAGKFMRRNVEIEYTPEESSTDAIIGKSDIMQELYKSIGRVASTDATVLICGESGTGKELVARAIYQHGNRSDKPFLVINCVAIPDTLLESELFGYEKGAFTGADTKRIGKIEKAHEGTIFLDEIGDMPMNIQSKILRLLQEQSIERLGGHESISVDVRIIAATNKDLESAMEEGNFREDLYYRLNVVKIEVPPLRDRRSDISLLIEYYLSRYSKEMSMENPGITNEAIHLCEGHQWKGNVRELANVIKKAIIFSRGMQIGKDELLKIILEDSNSKNLELYDMEKNIPLWLREKLLTEKKENLFSDLVDSYSKIIISEALNLTEGNRTKAAKLLGLSRPTLQAKIDKYNLKIKATVDNR